MAARSRAPRWGLRLLTLCTTLAVLAMGWTTLSPAACRRAAAVWDTRQPPALNAAPSGLHLVLRLERDAITGVLRDAMDIATGRLAEAMSQLPLGGGSLRSPVQTQLTLETARLSTAEGFVRLEVPMVLGVTLQARDVPVVGNLDLGFDLHATLVTRLRLDREGSDTVLRTRVTPDMVREIRILPRDVHPLLRTLVVAVQGGLEGTVRALLPDLMTDLELWRLRGTAHGPADLVFDPVDLRVAGDQQAVLLGLRSSLGFAGPEAWPAGDGTAAPAEFWMAPPLVAALQREAAAAADAEGTQSWLRHLEVREGRLEADVLLYRDRWPCLCTPIDMTLAAQPERSEGPLRVTSLQARGWRPSHLAARLLVRPGRVQRRLDARWMERETLHLPALLQTSLQLAPTALVVRDGWVVAGGTLHAREARGSL